MALIVLITGSVLWGIVWWQDRPLNDIAGLLDREDFQKAIRQSDQYLARHPADTRAKILKARGLSALDRHPAADSLFQQVAMQSNGFPDDRAALRAWSTSLLHLEKWGRAISILETLSKGDPADPDILYQLTVARIRLKQYLPALESAQQLAAIAGHENEADVMIAAIHHDKGDRRSALEAWERVLSRNPQAENLQVSPAEFFTMMGDDLLELGQAVNAAAVLERALKASSSARAHALLGKAYAQTGRQEEAVRSWQAAIAIEDLNATAREELANTALRNGQPQQAVDLLLPLTTSQGTLASSAAYILQRAYTQLQQPDLAAEWRDRTNALRETEKLRGTITSMLQRSSDPFWSSYLHAYQLASERQWAGAGEIIEDLLRKKPDEPHLRDLAEAVAKRGALPSLDHLISKQY